MLFAFLLTVAMATHPGLAAVRQSWTNPKMALLVIDVQDCFLQGGSLAVPDGNDVIPVINGIRQRFGDAFSTVALSIDWHLPGHVSFASAHPGKHVSDDVKLGYQSNGTLVCTETGDTYLNVDCSNLTAPFIPLDQRLWPDHCLQNVTSGPTSSGLSRGLAVSSDDVFIYKGTHRDLDSYSAFYDNGEFSQTQLDGLLKARGITHVFVTGLASDYCVRYTSIDASKLGYKTYTIMDATRGVAMETVDQATVDMASQGVTLIRSDDLAKVINEIMVGSASSRVAAPFTTCLPLMVTGLAFFIAG